ncbi:hypothetical protein [Chryseolinea lacunae]|uniref:SlyX protein n=1 Tax=Chryseolinea lacunae TaxID=2801331 RepID=A0ABS1KYE0_9BACT|nr:hypothetical protein [Chryseolinea lacunae]MBL0744465.1 hypothetical protein [Chryseolinea lacunae]
MVDGKTIDQLRQDLDSLRSEVKRLTQIVSVLEQKTAAIDALDIEKLQALIEGIKPKK